MAKIGQNCILLMSGKYPLSVCYRMRSTIPLSEERLLSILACGLSSFGFLRNILCQFIHEHMGNIHPIKIFAHTQLLAAATMSDLALRNHAAKSLAAIAADLDPVETSQEQYAKSRGVGLSTDSESATLTWKAEIIVSCESNLV